MAEIEAREKVATEGPWIWDGASIDESETSYRAKELVGVMDWEGEPDALTAEVMFTEQHKMPFVYRRSPMCVLNTSDERSLIEYSERDASFIAHARTDIPYLIARVRDLEAEVERLKRA